MSKLQRKYMTKKYGQPTLRNEVSKLKRQVATNKKELKYYDGFFEYTNTGRELFSQSFFKNVVDADGNQVNPSFIGRKAHIKRIECRVGSGVIQFLLWREKRAGKDVLGFTKPLALDPEYHTLLRAWEKQTDDDVSVKHLDVRFGGSGRLLEFDDATAVNQGDIVAGDIKANIYNGSNPTLPYQPISFRVWYTDG